MDAREGLVKLMGYKHECIKHETGWDGYFTKEDAKELRELDEMEAESVVEYIYDQIENDYIGDAKICPFCVAYDQNCEVCGYGERHGFCGNPDSEYDHFVEEHGCVKSMVDDDDMIEILKPYVKDAAIAYEYHINLNERGEFNADVRHPETGESVYEINAEMMRDMICNGDMKHINDIDGLEALLKELGIIREKDFIGMVYK